MTQPIHKIVPIEPTEEMMHQALRSLIHDGNRQIDTTDLRFALKAMLASCPDVSSEPYGYAINGKIYDSVEEALDDQMLIIDYEPTPLYTTAQPHRVAETKAYYETVIADGTKQIQSHKNRVAELEADKARLIDMLEVAKCEFSNASSHAHDASDLKDAETYSQTIIHIEALLAEMKGK